MSSNTYVGATVQLYKTYTDSNYTITIGSQFEGQQLGIGTSGGQWVYKKYPSYFEAGNYFWTYGYDWKTCGFISPSQQIITKEIIKYN